MAKYRYGYVAMPRHLSGAARDKMLAAAQDVIAEHGIDGFTVDEVARRSGVAKTTIYRHFDSGAALAVHALDSMIEDFPSFDTGSLRGDLQAFLQGIMAHINDPAMRQTMSGLFAVSAREPEFARVHRAMLDERKAPLRTAFQRAMARGELSPETDIDLAIAMIEGPLVYRRVLLDEVITPADATTLIDLILRALSVDS